MNRRNFLATGVGGAVGVGATGWPQVSRPAGDRQAPTDIREMFPRLERDVFLNAAAGTPLSTFTEEGLRSHEALWRWGPGEGRGEAFGQMLSDARTRFAALIKAEPSEIAFVQCTKAGEQVVLDGLPSLRDRTGNVVTNDLHFSGSLHNLVGLRRAGLDVRIVRSTEWRVDPSAMEAAMDDRTALVDVALVSNVNGHVEDIRALADMVHARGGYLYADIIQAAGIVPIDVRAMGIDFAACSGYKWLYGPHGVAFFYVRQELQGTALPDHLFPGHVRHNYSPWVQQADPELGEFTFRSPVDAARYQPGHVSYLGYAAVNRGLRFIDDVGVEEGRRHSVALAVRLREQLDPARYRTISPGELHAPIVSFVVDRAPELEPRLRAANLVISVGANRIRVSPAIYNTESDIDLLAEVLNG